jgi:hypothetical protein
MIDESSPYRAKNGKYSAKKWREKNWSILAEFDFLLCRDENETGVILEVEKRGMDAEGWRHDAGLRLEFQDSGFGFRILSFGIRV